MVERSNKNSGRGFDEFLSQGSDHAEKYDETEDRTVIIPNINDSDNSSEMNDKRQNSVMLYDSDAEEVATEIDTLIDNANVEKRNSTFINAPGEGH